MEEMHHITKAVGFTGNTIKRWLATSPRPNTDQTEEMAEPEPTTPVRLIKDEAVHINGLEGLSNAPRKKSITIRASSSRSASIPSSHSEEPQTPSHSPKIIFQSSVDGRIFAESDDADDVVANVDPAIKDPVRVFVQVNFNMRVSSYRDILSLDCPRDDLIKVIARRSAEWRASQPELLKLLDAHGKCVHMVGRIHLDKDHRDDHRDFYVNGNEQECYRFETLRDFFDSQELYFLQQTGILPSIGVIVNVKVENMPKGGGTSEYPPPTPQPPTAYHRVGGHQIDFPRQNSQHSPLRIGLYAPYNPTTGQMSPTFIEIHERSIHGLPIGSFANPMPHKQVLRREHLEPKYQPYNTTNGELELMVKQHIDFNVAMKYPEKNVAELPSMTFNELSRPEGHTDSISNEPIHLAIRLVNALPRHMQHIRLPANTLMTVSPGKGTKAAIEAALKSELYAFGKRFLFDHLGIGTLFHEQRDEDGKPQVFWGDHRLELWVLPRKGDGRMHFFERGSLKWFLDGERAGRGDRRLYVEAWILPKEERGVLRVLGEGEGDE